MITNAVSDMQIVMIPAKTNEEIKHSGKRLKVAAYCRVSTDQEEQESSYEAQIDYYTEKIGKNTEWQMAGIFADEGITGTQAKKRPEFLKMIQKCRQRKIDVILTKSLSRFARNTVDSLNYIRELKALGIAVIFEKENINTLETDTEMMLTIMSCFAQKTYVTDCITKKSRKNNGELPMYLVKNHHEPIISRADFNWGQEEMARRSAKRSIAEKLTKTEQGKYSAKYALSELLICGECGEHYRRVTWTAKGFKEIKWRCISRIQYGKKKCHSSPTVDEQALHKALVSAINEFCEVKDDVASVLREGHYRKDRRRSSCGGQTVSGKT